MGARSVESRPGTPPYHNPVQTGASVEGRGMSGDGGGGATPWLERTSV